MNKPTYYITTPIYYPSGNWHLGHSYTTVCCDAIARFKRMQGFDVFYLTGTDEHGQKIEKRALEAGVTPKAFVDKLVDELKELWKLLDISNDKFIRTTDDYHMAAVQKIFKDLYDKGEIYKSKYKGKYCTPCEAFWTETQAKDGKCPDCGREVIEAEEECYFFKLSKYRDRIMDLLTKTDFLQPQSRVNEMVNNFLKDGLEDLAVSRTSFKWGIPVSFDEGHVVYVWIDALTNYINALGYGGDDALLKKYWPADLHMVGKEIVRFHSIIWPAILMALDLPLPKKVFGHGWLLFGGDKMSKSKGNVVDPFVLAERYGVDTLRYFLLREIPFGSDGLYTNEAYLNRINADIVNDLGNLLRRSIAMATQYFGGKVTKTDVKTEFDDALIAKINALYGEVCTEIDKLTVNKALEKIFSLISDANKYIDLTKPWALSKDENEKGKLSNVLYNLLETLRVAATMLTPFLTKYPKQIFDGLGLCVTEEFGANVKYGAIDSYTVNNVPPLKERLDIPKELKILESLAAEKSGIKTDESGKKSNKNINTDGKAVGNDKSGKTVGNDNKANKEGGAMQDNGIISIDDFFKTKLKVAKVLQCEKVVKSEKLLKLKVKIGEEERIIVSGIAKYYSAEEMVGKSVVVVSNLKPAKLCGIESNGMILCASIGDKLVLVTPESIIEDGAEVC